MEAAAGTISEAGQAPGFSPMVTARVLGPEAVAAATSPILSLSSPVTSPDCPPSQNIWQPKKEKPHTKVGTPRRHVYAVCAQSARSLVRAFSGRALRYLAESESPSPNLKKNGWRELVHNLTILICTHDHTTSAHAYEYRSVMSRDSRPSSSVSARLDAHTAHAHSRSHHIIKCISLIYCVTRARAPILYQMPVVF
jgi:hypothetical protein